MRSESELDAIARQVIGASIEVHRRIGPGCFESAYTPCLAYELAGRGLRFDTAVSMDLFYDGLVVPRAYQIDMIIEEAIVIEVKAVEDIGRVHARQMLTYLKLTGLALGLLLNFGAPTMAEGTKRIVNHFPHGSTPFGRRTRSHAEAP